MVEITITRCGNRPASAWRPTGRTAAMLDACEELGIGFVPWGPTMRALLADDMTA
jgi:aryl-alcohol dehydrogenase-like predicted oxidoreductase